MEFVNSIVQLGGAFLIADDTLLDKPYAKKMDLVYHQWSGKRHQIVNGSTSAHCYSDLNKVGSLWLNSGRKFH